MDISQHNGLPIRLLLLECCGSCKWQGDCHILRKIPSMYPDFVCDFYKRKRVSGALRRKKAKIHKEYLKQKAKLSSMYEMFVNEREC